MWYAGRKYRLERRAARAFGLKDYAGAIRALEDLLRVVGENPNTLHVMATCRQRLGDHHSAIATAERGIAADPDHLACLKLLAECHAAREELQTARAYASRALALMEARTPGLEVLPGTIRPLAAAAARAAGGSAEQLEWRRWARALCESGEGAVE